MTSNIHTTRASILHKDYWLDKLRIVPWPFTFPLADVRLYFFLLPLFWVAGVEQLIPLFWFSLAFIKLLLVRSRIRVPLPARIAVVFLMWQWVSALSITVTSNWLVFLKNFSSYLVGVLAFLLIVNAVKTRRHFDQVLLILVLLSLAVSLIGLGFVVGVLPRSFQSLVGTLLPGFLRNSTFIRENVLLREIGRQTVLWGIPGRQGGLRFRRVSSIFIYSTKTAQFYVFLIPLQVFLIRKFRGWKRLALILLLMISVLVFVLTATRMPVIALVLSAALILVFRYVVLRQPPERRRPFVRLVFALIVVFAVLFAFLFLSLIGGGSLEGLLKRGRPGSYMSRSQIYQVTMESWTERPITGWGTQRKLPELPSSLAPSGTHSEYMAYLYRYGLVGLLLHLSAYAAVWFSLVPRVLSRSGVEDKDAFLTTFAISLFAFNLNAVVHGFEWDVTIPLVLWTMIGLCYFSYGPRADARGDAGVPGEAQA